MSSSAPLDVIPLWAFFLLTIVLILLIVEVGYRLGRWRSGDQEKESPVGAMVGALLGLLGFLLAFTFGLAASRFESRRAILLDEANAIGTAHLRAGMLPEPHRTTVRRLLLEYVDVRLEAVQQGSILSGIRRSEELHGQLWVEAEAAAAKDTHSIPTGLFVEALNDVIDLHANRVGAGLRSRIPLSIWGVLILVAGLALGAMGYQGGLARTARSPATLAVAITFAAVLWLIADLDCPDQGLLRVSQQPLTDLRNSIAPPEGQK